MTTLLLSYLANALWQAPVVFAAAWLAARLLSFAGPSTKLRLWCTALVFQAALPALPARSFSWMHLFPLHAVPASATISIQQGSASVHAGLHLPPGLAFALIFCYVMFLLYRVARLVHAFVLTLRLRRNARPCFLEGEAAGAWAECQSRFRLPATRLAESNSLRTPITLGLYPPHILFPSGLLSRLVPDEMQALFAHEAAHISRHDFGWNLALQVVALPIAFLPTSRLTLLRISESREIVCDALAADAVPQLSPESRGLYARSLLRLAAILIQDRSDAVPQPVALGIFDGSTLERRIMSLTRNVPRPSTLRRAALFSAALTVGLATSASAVALHTTLASPGAYLPATQQPADPVRVGGGVMAGQLRSHVAPKYPQAAKDAGVQGTVLLHAVIAKDGVIDQLTVVSGPPELQASALEAVHQWIYEPYLLNGEPTEVETTITINFTLAK